MRENIPVSGQRAKLTEMLLTLSAMKRAVESELVMADPSNGYDLREDYLDLLNEVKNALFEMRDMLPRTPQAAPVGPAMSNECKEYFTRLVNDAGNWSGTPMIDHLGSEGQKQDGYLTNLKRLGLVQTFTDRGVSFARFTPAGRAFMKQLGYDPVERTGERLDSDVE